MVVSKSISKLDAYFERLKTDRADRIKPDHVEAILDKLAAKKKALAKELDEAKKEDKKERIKGKIAVVKEQVKRAEWLLKEIQ